MPVAWYIDRLEEKPQEEHHLNPPKYLNLDNLYSLTGVEYWKINVDGLEADLTYSNLKKTRGYDYEDEVEISPSMPNYEEKLKMFYAEHLHEDEEIRLFLRGSGYFDVRDRDDKWVRIQAEKGDLLVLPSGIYHRFTPDILNYAKVKRLFCGTPVWKAIDRPAEELPAREKYLSFLSTLT